MKYDEAIKQMEQDVLGCLMELETRYGSYKCFISQETGIPEDILTVVLKRLKDAGKIKLMSIFNEDTGMFHGRGYFLNWE